MHMIDLMKRLAELDSKNPNVVKESKVDECGMMPEMGMGMERPSMPASINVTAGSGEELGNVLKDIMSLAGVKPAGAEEPLSAEPTLAIGVEPERDMDPNSSMRSVMDLMNPDADDEMDQMGGDDHVDQAMGDVDNDGDHDMGDHDLEKDDEEDSGEDDEEADEGQYDNSPANPIKPPMFNANKYAHQENQPGQGDRMDGTSPKAYADMNEATADLFAQYKHFVSESKPSAGMTKGEKSSVVKKAKAGKDIGKPGKNFDKVAAKAGGGEKGKKIAAAAMWKNAAKK